MPTLGDPLPTLALPQLDGTTHPLTGSAGQIVVIVFWSAECGWSRRCDEWLKAEAGSWKARGIALFAVAANAHEDDALVRQAAAERALAFPIFRDPGQGLTAWLGATHTPHVFVYDRAGRLAYQGAFDDRTFRRRKATINYLAQALAALEAGRAPEPAETAPYGCMLVRG